MIKPPRLISICFFSVAFSLVGSASASDLVCKESLVSYTVDGKERVESTRLCVDELTRPSGAPLIQALASENCVKTLVDTGKTCVALRKAFEASYAEKRERSRTVAPSRFDLCLRLGGEPESIRFQWNRTWHVSDRCRFNEDFSYVDTTTLSNFRESPFKQQPP